MNQARPRILVLPSWYPPDGGQFFQDQAEALAACDLQMDLLVNRVVGLTKIRRAHFHTYRRFAVSEQQGTRIIRSAFLKGPRMEAYNINRWIRSTLRLYRKYVARFGKPDLLMAHSSIWAGVVAARIKEEDELPFILVEHRSRFTMDADRAGGMLKPAYRSRLEYCFSMADRIVTVSDALQASIRNYLPESMHGKLQSIPNMVDTQVFDPGPFIKGGTKSEGILRILSVGRLEWEKGMDLLIGAVARLAGEGTKLELRIVGEGPERSALERAVESSGMASAIHFKGKLSGEALLEEFRAADAFALASRFEAFGVVFIEAMSMGLPVLATRAGGPQHFIPDLAGMVVASEDEAALYDGLKSLLARLDDYDPATIRNYAETHFSSQAYARQYTSLITSLLHA